MHAKCWSAVNVFQQAHRILEKARWQFQVHNVQWLIITEPMEIIYLEQLLTCKEKKPT